MVCPCCVPPEPCSVFVGSEKVAITSLDPLDWLDVACWGGAVPGGTTTLLLNGDIAYEFDSGWYWEYYVLDSGTGAAEKEVFSAGLERWQLSVPEEYEYTEVAGLYGTKVISATECLLYGHVNVQYSVRPENADPPNYGAWLDYNSLWRWESTITNGVPGDVSMVPVVGYQITYDETGQNINETAASYGPTPTVTLTFAP